LPPLTERTSAEIALVCQFTYLEGERLLQCRRCIRHVTVEALGRATGEIQQLNRGPSEQRWGGI
jgi:hypothetical protein